MHIARNALLIFLVGWLSVAAADHGTAADPQPGYIYGRVIKIADGDTLTILNTDKQQIKIRLAEIDTPERGQPYSRKATDAPSDLVFGKDVAVRFVDTGQYGRTVGRVYVGETDVEHLLAEAEKMVGMKREPVLRMVG
ncbi:MAG: thermonuclease family protein [Gammaproteobacteria bacterium]|nr:thermonuclease family protein [Gammaproteobacteria bacterium]